MQSIADRQVADIVAALDLLPEDIWDANDDACDCTFQRIGMWTNPYLGETLEVRMCCIWAELYRMFPEHVRVVKAWKHGDEWQPGVWDWNGEDDMPRSIWYRHLARREGITVAEARERYAHLSPPVGTPRPTVEAEAQPDPVSVLFEMVMGLAQRVAELEGAHEDDR
jgi:hypothetical protein